MFKKKLLTVMAGVLLFSSVTYGAAVSASPQPINSVKELHEFVVQNGFASLNDRGQIVINADANKLGVSEELYKDYVSDMNSVNAGVETGGLEFDDNLQIHVLTENEMIIEFTNNNKNLIVEENGNLIQPFGDPGGPALRNVYSLAQSNRNTLETFYQSVIDSGKYQPHPPDAYSASVSYFVAKVRPGGDWDYKVVSGYGPWYNEYTCVFKNNVREVQNAAYIGNYNYGYVGRFLFSLNVLLAGGDGVSIVTGKKPDGEDDKAPIRRGYNESYK